VIQKFLRTAAHTESKNLMVFLSFASGFLAVEEFAKAQAAISKESRAGACSQLSRVFSARMKT
jgi:nitrate/TMAO reductase-like tetraheme cytochrome c subunit